MIATSLLGAMVPPPVTTSPMTTKSKKRARKSVSFYPKVTLKYCPHFSDYTPEEKRNTWLTSYELKKIRYSCHKLAREFSKPNAPMDGTSQNGDCLRGLEGRTSQGLAKKKRVKIGARNAVFDEQNLQIGIGFRDEEAIADVYYEHTEYAQIDAHMRGLRDQVDALVPPQSSNKENLAPVANSKSTLTANASGAATARNPLFLAINCGSGTNGLLRSTSSRRLLTDKFFNA